MATPRTGLSFLAVVVIGLALAGTTPAVGDLAPPKPPPFSASRYVSWDFLAPDLTRERCAVWPVSATSVPDQVTLHVWSTDQQLRKLFSGPESDLRVLAAEGLLLVRDHEHRAWRLESWLTGQTLTIPFEIASEHNPWMSATRDLRLVAVENRVDREHALATFYVNGEKAGSYDRAPWSPHAQMTEDGYVALLTGPRDLSSAAPVHLILFDRSGGIRWRTELAEGEPRLGSFGVYPATEGRGVLCAAYLPDAEGSRVFQFFGADAHPCPAFRFDEATQFHTWVGATTTALFESERDVATPGHTLTLADCEQGRIVWQVSQPDVDLSTLLVVDDPTRKLGCQVIAQAVHRTWEGGKRTGFYPPYGLVQLRFLRADNGRLIDSFECVSVYVGYSPARFHRRGDELWLVQRDGAMKIDLTRALSQAAAAGTR